MRRSEYKMQSVRAIVSLSISKLHGVSWSLQRSLKAQGITTCGQLLIAAGPIAGRETLSLSTRIPPDLLVTVVRRADMARIKGIGLKFGQLLEEVDVLDVATLARQDPQVLHGRLRDHHAAERLTRRSPTPAEVEDWVNQASILPILVCHSDQASSVYRREAL